MLDFGRDLCGDLGTAAHKEWLVTNGLGGFASGTVKGLLTRRYHGLLIAALQPPAERTLLVAKIDETVTYAGRAFPLFTNHWSGGVIDPDGYRNIERFRLEGTTPIWTFALADALLEKRIWMQPGENTTYLSYRLVRARGPVELRFKVLANYRDYHGATRGDGWRMQVDPVERGLRVQAYEGATPFFVLSDRAEAQAWNEWYRGFSLSVEQYRGLEALEDHLHIGSMSTTLAVGQSVLFALSTEPEPVLDATAAWDARRCHEHRLLAAAPALPAPLVLAADQFIAQRSLPGVGDEQVIIAGYHWFGDWTRDALISLPGLTLATGRLELARGILLTQARHFDQGLLPNRFPDGSGSPEYNTVDATLWYFEALRAYHAVTEDEELLRVVYPKLRESIDWHLSGTRYQIHVDPDDGLLYAGEPGVQLTWMDAKVGDWVVTPRTGKPVEVNALWYNALRIMADFAQRLGEPATPYVELADRVKRSFSRFWNKPAGYCYDVIDGPARSDPALRPNQLLAVSLHHSPLTPEQQKAVVDVSANCLLTSHGLRSLAPEDPAYIGRYGGDARQRDAAYHQGTVWGWLMGPFVSAHLRVYRDPVAARSFLAPLQQHLGDHGLGSVSELFDGDPPFTPRGCIAQAWSVAELLRVLHELEDFDDSSTRPAEHPLSRPIAGKPVVAELRAHDESL